jgi:aminopeptidase-like protein
MFSFTRTPLNAMRVRVCMSSRSHVMTPLPHSRALSSSSSSSTTAFAFQAVNTSRIKDATFSIEQGSKVCIIGSDEKGTIHTTRYTIPYHTIPYHTLPYHTIHTIPYHTIHYHTIPYHTIHYHTLPYHTAPHSALLCSSLL